MTLANCMVTSRMCIAHTASVMFSQFLSFLLSTGGGSRQMHYLANIPGIEHILAIKVLMPVGGGGSGHMHHLANVPKKVLMPSNIPECHACCLY